MYLAEPQSGLGGWLAEQGDEGLPPYWAYLWGGGAVLARYVLDHPEVVSGKRVLDFGAGCGVVGIAAALAGATVVQASEADANGRVALALNAEANGLTVDIMADAGALPDVDVVLAGDVFYLEKVAAVVLPWLIGCAEAGKTVLVGDPYRKTLPLECMDLIEDGMVPDFGSATPVRAGVFTLRRRSDGTLTG